MRAALRALVLALALASCGRTGGDDGASGGSQAANAPAIDAPSANFLERVAGAASKVAHTGTRRVYFEYPVGDAVATLQYTERVVSNGAGGFAIDPVAIESPQMTAGERELFALLQKNREGFFYRYRDFHIEDLPLFTQAYRMRVTGYEPVIVSRACVELEIVRNELASSSYLVAVDPATGLVLRCEEIGAGGRVVARVEFLDLVLEADPDVELHVDRASSPLDLADTVEELGFRVLVPKRVPAGFVLREADRIEDEEGQRWARLVYGDGAAQVFLLHTDLARSANASVAGSEAGDGLDRNSVRVLQVGPWTIAQGFIGSHRLIAMGKLDAQALLAMLDSAL